METIIKQIEKLEEIFRQRKNISRIEKDLILEKLRHLYDRVLDKNVETILPVEKIELTKESPKETEEISSIEIDEKIQELESEKEEIATEELLVVNAEKREEPEIIVQPEASIDLFSTEEVEPTNEQAETVVDKISKEQNKETVADIFQKNKISSLKDAIGINEKFFFINELFSGELNVYNQSIEKLDQFETEVESKQFLVDLKEKFDWDIETEAFLQLQDFVQKKYTP